ncbi:hypothetical protein ACIODS_12310 [Micromonospora chalcea]|uniref:hypothetical protein n=1 Tax=Micromonospora chalcea TaxID=1874 RepID=UPI00382C2BFE
MVTCNLCPPDDNHVHADSILDHLRLMHPDEYGDGPARWPDGGNVVVDTTIEPDDITNGGQQ